MSGRCKVRENRVSNQASTVESIPDCRRKCKAFKMPVRLEANPLVKHEWLCYTCKRSMGLAFKVQSPC